jgi:hypothetical protein
MSEWRPIETAPKDGTNFWAAQAGAPECGLIYFDDAWRQWISVSEGYNPPNWEPTHWMPLPTPPDQPNCSLSDKAGTGL